MKQKNEHIAIGIEEEYNIEVENMDKRVDVFINQLLPDMFDAIDSVKEAWFQIQVLHRLCKKLTPKLNEEQDKKIDKAVCEWITKWEVRIKEVAGGQKNENPESNR